MSEFAVKLADVGNPLALMETDSFGIEVWAEFDGTTLSKQIAFAKELKIPASKFVAGELTKFSMTAVNEIVQEGSSHTLTFTSQSAIPS